MKKIAGQFRQGDILAENAVIPKGAKNVAPVNGRYVIAEGEATGHAHTIDASLGELYEKDGVLYFKPYTDAPWEHQEHAVITLPKPKKFTRQREWTDAQEPRQVLD